MKEVYKTLGIGLLLACCGCVSVHYGESDLAGVCFGALAGYVIKNGSGVVRSLKDSS